MRVLNQSIVSLAADIFQDAFDGVILIIGIRQSSLCDYIEHVFGGGRWIVVSFHDVTLFSLNNSSVKIILGYIEAFRRLKMTSISLSCHFCLLALTQALFFCGEK
jgi:hypothetical protein